MVSKKPTIEGSVRVLTSIVVVNEAWQYVVKLTPPLYGIAGPALVMQEPQTCRLGGYLGQG